ncbi:MAG: sodium:solute symporter family protein [Candidatus Melainabacteria bacterium]|nr:sodium:solute symporter family protein [Candidatus Melainabacteria bacterium]
MLTWIVIFLVAYVLAVIGVTRYLGKRANSLFEYFLASRSLGALPVALTFVATWFGATSTKGSLDAYHQQGLSALWLLAIPSVVSLLVIALVFAKRVSQNGCRTQPEAVEKCYGPTGRLLLALTILASSTTLVAAQLVAVGQVLQHTLGLDLAWGVWMFLLGVITYATVGGYRAVVLTDILQMIFIVVAIFIMGGFSLASLGNQPAVLHHLQAQPASFWNIGHHGQENATMALSFVFAWCIAPEMWQRMASTQNDRMAFRAALGAFGILLVLYCLVFAVGIVSAGLFPSSQPVDVLVSLARAMPHPALAALIFMGFFAAVTSSMDSPINVASMTWTQDIYQRFIRPKASNTELLWISRLATILLPLPAAHIAISHPNIIGVLWMSADIYASVMFIPVVGLLYAPKLGRLSGVLAMAFGGVSIGLNVLRRTGLDQGWLNALGWPDAPYATLIGVGLSAIGFALGALLQGRAATGGRGNRLLAE